MQKRITLLLTGLALLSAVTSKAQSWGFSNIGNWGQEISVAADGSVWVVGYGGDDPGWGDVGPDYVAKLNADGEKLFGVHPSLTGVLYYYAQDVLPTADGGAIVYAAAELGQPWVYKLDASGTKVWESGPLGVANYIYGGKAVQLNDGRIIIGGLGDFEHIFFEVDPAGTLLSTFTVEPDTGAAWAWSYWDYKEAGMVATADGGFAYATGNSGNRIVLKFNSDLTEGYAAYYPWDLPWEYGYNNTIKTTSDGGLLLSGSGTDALGNYKGTVRKIDSDGNLLWSQSYNHGSTIEEGGYALELASGDIIAWTQDNGDQSSAGWLLDPATGDEIGSIDIPILGGYDIFFDGYNGIEINDVESAADGGYYITGRMYLADYDQRMVVLKSNADGTFEPCIFDCVWPGDANNDGYATGDDLFEIGINYGATGTDRDDMTIDWAPKLAQMWMEPDTLYWYIMNDLKWTDCNGNGVINDDDTTAVVNNLGLDHPLNPARLGAGDVPLYLDPAVDYLSIGMNEIPIMLGDDVTSVDEIYGITFTINVDGENIDGYSLKINWDDSWIGTVGETLSLSKNFGATKQVSGSIVRKTRTNTGGSGQIGTLQIVVVDNISGKMELSDVEISFSYANAVMLDRETIPMTTETLTISAEDNSGITTNEEVITAAYPNPASDMVYFNFNNASPERITIADVTGKIMMDVANVANWNNGVNISGLAAGNYIIQYNFGTHIKTEQLSIQ